MKKENKQQLQLKRNYLIIRRLIVHSTIAHTYAFRSRIFATKNPQLIETTTYKQTLIKPTGKHREQAQLRTTSLYCFTPCTHLLCEQCSKLQWNYLYYTWYFVVPSLTSSSQFTLYVTLFHVGGPLSLLWSLQYFGLKFKC